MGYTYCTKLSVDSNAINNNSASFNPQYGFPFAGYVNFTDYDDPANPFEASDDYLQRWDTGSGMIEPVKNSVMCSEENNTCVKINDMYCSTVAGFPYTNQESFDRNTNKVFLSMVPLSKNINSDNRGLSFFMDMENEIKTQKTIDLKYSTSSTVNLCNLDFCAAGFCKSNIPYIGLEYVSRMINSRLYRDNNNYYTLYSSNGTSRANVLGNSEKSSLRSGPQSSSAFITTYEFPGAGKLFLSPLSVYNNNSSSDSSLGEVTSTTYCKGFDNYSELYNCLAYKLCKKIMKVIGSILGFQTTFGITHYNSITKSYTIGFDANISYDGNLYNKVNSYLRLLSQSGEVYYKNNNEVFEKQEAFGLSIQCIKIQDDPEYEGPDIPIYEWGEFRIGESSSCSLYGKSLSYYLEQGEKFNINNNDYASSIINNGTYFFVIRSVANILLPGATDTSLYTCDATKSYLNKCNSTIPAGSLYNRMDLYPNTSGKMRFLDSSLDSSDSSYKNPLKFKPQTSQLLNADHLFMNYIPAFNAAPVLDGSNKLSRMGVIEDDVKIKFNGNLYVSEVTLVFEGETIKGLASTIIIGGVRRNVKTDGLKNSYGNTEYVFQFTKPSDSPARIVSSIGKPSSSNMNVYAVGTHQMLKYCSFPGYTKNKNINSETVEIRNIEFDDIYRLDNNSTYNSVGDSSINPEDSQMTFTKIIGRIPVYITGSGTYKNNDIKVKLISAYVKLTDESSLDIKVNTLGINSTDGYSTTDSPLYCMTTDSSLFKFVSPAKVELLYTIHRPFLGSMSGDIPRYTGNNSDSSLYNMGVSSFTSDSYKSKIGLDSLNNIICVGPNYSDSSANGRTTNTFSTKRNSVYVNENDVLEFTQLEYDLGLADASGNMIATDRGTSVGPNSVYYSMDDKPIAADSRYNSISDQLNPSSDEDKSYIELSLPEPHLSATLVYDSVQFNKASAWSFVRSMPLNPGSAEAPHILIYKVEAWVTRVENGTNVVDSSATESMHFDHTKSYIYSGYADSNIDDYSTDSSYHFCVMGINECVNDPYILNNCYLKVDDGGNNEELNAVGTAFPIIDITAVNDEEVNTVGTEDSSSIIGDITAGNTNFCDYYGAPALNAVIYDNDASFGYGIDVNNDDDIYNKLYDLAKKEFTENTSNTNSQVVVLSYCRQDLIQSQYSTGSGDKRKIIYICVGFYNNRNEMIPINGKFGITYDVKVSTSEGDVTTSYTKYMSLSQFFPKDSMIYLAGNGYKGSTKDEKNNKIAFVTQDVHKNYASLVGDGLYDNSSGNETESGEIINIGPGDGGKCEISYEISSSSKSVGHVWGNISDDSVSPEYAGHYGILNRYSGKVSFVSNVPYKNYKEYTDSLEGKCLLKQEHICYFPNKSGVVTLL